MTTHAEREEPTFPWWLILLEGIFAALFGFLLLIAPGATLLFLVQLLGFYLLISGILRIVSIFIDSSSWVWKLTVGIIGLLAGLVVLQHPLWSTIAVPTYVVYFVGAIAIAEGAIGLFQAFQGDGWGVGVLGILSIILGLVLVFNPVIGLVTLPFVLGILMIFGGVAAILVSFSMRSSSISAGA